MIFSGSERGAGAGVETGAAAERAFLKSKTSPNLLRSPRLSALIFPDMKAWTPESLPSIMSARAAAWTVTLHVGVPARPDCTDAFSGVTRMV